jgi:transcriptional regulator with XRE-family HTH domain
MGLPWSIFALEFYVIRREPTSKIDHHGRMSKNAEPEISIFGRRLREARQRIGMPQDKLGVEIGLDESSSSARISRYETGKHEAPYATAQKLAKALGIPVAYLYCDDDRLAELILKLGIAKKKQVGEVEAILADVQ